MRLQRLPFLFLLMFVVLGVARAQQGANPTGTWQGAIRLPGNELEVTVKLRQEEGAWRGSIDIPAQGAKELPLETIVVASPGVSFSIAGIPGSPTFKGNLSATGDTLTGLFTQGGGVFPFTLKRHGEVERRQAEAVMSATFDSIRTLVATAMKDWRVPGLAMAVVKGDSVIFAEGFGLRDREGNLPVTSNTLFAIGSSTKAFTSCILGTLVAEEKLEWDKPIVEYLPEFKLKDRFATEKMTARDLLNHVSGLPRHDYLWYGTSMNRRELFERLQYLEPNADFRSRWQYQNLMFMTAGYLAERISGKTWETLVRERIFDPLGMTSSNLSVDSMKVAADHALPYEKKKDEVTPMEFRSLDAVGPAGSINSTVSDMARWVTLNLGNGTYRGRQVLASDVMEELHSGDVVMSAGKPSEPDLLFSLYGKGWMISAYHGRRLLYHGGNIDGFSAMVSFMPEEHYGVVILTNLNANPLPDVVMFGVYDKLLGFHGTDWNAKLRLAVERADSLREAVEKEKQDDVARVTGTRPSHPFKDYAGEYEHSAYGVLTVRERSGKLEGTYNGMTVLLEHFHYDVFSVSEESNGFREGKVMFRMNTKGDIVSVMVPLEPSVPDIEFTRKASAALADTAVLRRYVGDYEIAGQAIAFRLDGSTLTMKVSGQPLYRLVPYKEREFTLKGLNGYSVRFEPEQGELKNAVLIQPNGTFTATRK